MTRDKLTRRILRNFEDASNVFLPDSRMKGDHPWRQHRGKLNHHLEQIEDAADELRAIAAAGGYTLGEYLKLPT